jgi:spore photoproduct lyase
LLELKTKCDCVDTLLDFDPKGRVVVAWSMNPQRVIDWDETDTASFSERLSAARRCSDQPAIVWAFTLTHDRISQLEKDYQSMIEEMFATIRLEAFVMAEFGRAAQYARLEARPCEKDSPVLSSLTGEQVLCPDGKLRYFQPLRVEMYRKMVGWIRSRRADGEDLSLHGIQRGMATGVRLRSRMRKRAWQ